MIHEFVITIIHLGWLLSPIPLYALYNKYYLDQNQCHLLIVQAILLFSLMLPGWIVHMIRLVCTGYFVLVVLDLCIVQFEEFLNRYEVSDKNARVKQFRKINGNKLFMVDYYRTMKKFKLKQTFIWPLFVLIWILIRIRFTRVVQYGKNQILYDGSIFQGFLITLDGWNCNYSQHTTITLLWLLILIFCQWFISKILQCARTDRQVSEQNYNDLNGYKIYLLSYLIRPAILVLGIDFLFNFVAHFGSMGLLDCYQYWKKGIIVVVVMEWGVAASIGLFFYQKIGRFSVESEHGNSQVSQDGEQMNQLSVKQRLLQTPTH